MGAEAQIQKSIYQKKLLSSGESYVYRKSKILFSITISILV